MLMAGSLVLATQDFTGRTNASYFPKVWEQVALGALFLAVVTGLWLSVRVSRWPCPHCGKLFFGPWTLARRAKREPQA